MIDHLLLRSFVIVVDTGNFTRAAEYMHLTQSTVSQHILRLEQSLGCRLLDRSQRQILPTEEGEQLLGYARRILRLADEARAALGSVHADLAVRLGVPEDFAGETLMPHLTQLVAKYPKLRLEVESGLSHQMLRLYRQGELDLLLTKQWGVDSDCHAHWSEPLCWVTSATHPCVSAVNVSQQQQLPLVAFPVGALYRQEMIQALESRNRPWRINYSSSSLTSLSAAVSAGLGVSLLPAASVASSHRVLGPEEGFPTITGLELALYARPKLDGARRSLRDSLKTLCAQRANH